jgi:hypothetical protein
MELLCFLTAFLRAATMMHWTTGQTLFKKFPSHLQASNLDIWMLSANSLSHTVVNFHIFIHSLKRTKFLGSSYNHQIDFLRTIQKPSELDQHSTAEP